MAISPTACAIIKEENISIDLWAKIHSYMETPNDIKLPLPLPAEEVIVNFLIEKFLLVFPQVEQKTARWLVQDDWDDGMMAAAIDKEWKTNPFPNF